MRRLARVHRMAVLLLPILPVLLLAGCDEAPAQVERIETSLPSVRSDRVRLSSSETGYRYPAKVRASERTSPAFLHSGVLLERYVVRGQRVAQDEPLAMLRHPAMAPMLVAAEAHVRELDARLGQLGRDVERARTLRERNLSAEEELDRLRSEREAIVQAREQAVARREEAKAQLEELTLRAPFDAEVVDVRAEPGDFVAAGQPVLALAGLAGREAEIRVPAHLAQRISVGQEVKVVAAFGARSLTGRIAYIGHAGETMAPVVIELVTDPAPALGEPLWVQLALVAEVQLQVPLMAVIDPGGHAPYVMTLNTDDIVERVSVTPGRLTHGWVTVTAADLKPGDRVITAGQGRLEAGARVRVLP